MNLTEDSDVSAVLRAAYIDGDLEAARPAAVRLALRIEHPLSASGRPHVTAAQMAKRHFLEAIGSGPLIEATEPALAGQQPSAGYESYADDFPDEMSIHLPDCENDSCGGCL
jgi:hypothetical protein